MSVKVSIIIPCYNVEKYIDETIQSLQNQTYTDFVVHCIDDASMDNTYEKLLSYSQQDNRIKVYRNEENIGVIDTLNKLITLCNTEWIIRMDSDDIFESSRVEKLMKKANEGPFHIVSTFYSFIDFLGNNIDNKRGLTLCTMDKSIKYMAMLNSPFPSQALFHKSIFEKILFDKKYKVAEDYYFFTKALDDTIRVANIPEKLYRYRINPNGLSNTNALLMRENHFEIAKEYAQNIVNIEEKGISFLKIGLKLIKYEQHSANEIKKMFKQMFLLKEKFCRKYSPTSDELKEIELYTKQYFVYTLFIFIKSDASINKKISVLCNLFSEIRQNIFNFKILKWLTNNQ